MLRGNTGRCRGRTWCTPPRNWPARAFLSPTRRRRACAGRRRGLERFPESRRIFLHGGSFYEAGDVFRQPDLAATLDRIETAGARDFYEGETAHRLARDMADHGGLITLDDLSHYRAIERKPLEGTYRGYTIVTAPPPSSGGVGVLQMLGVLEGTGFARGGAGSAQAVHYMAEAMRRYFADRSENLGDPDFVRVPLTVPARAGPYRAAAERPSIRSAPRPRARSEPSSSTAMNLRRPRTFPWRTVTAISPS